MACRVLRSRPRTRADYRRLLAMRLVRLAALELWVANADGSNARWHEITHLGGANWAPSFFPDGKRIIFASNYEDPHRGEFRSVPGARGWHRNGEDHHARPNSTAFPMFSPDGDA